MRKPDREIRRIRRTVAFESADERFGGFGVDAASLLLPDDLERLFNVERLPVRARRRQGVKRIDDVNDARHERNFVSLQPLGISGPVRILVVVQHAVQHDPQTGDRLQDLRPHPRMLLDDVELFRRQLARLAQDFLGNSDLADVVQQPRPLHRLGRRRRHAHFLGGQPR